jgi:hypothetical protein
MLGHGGPATILADNNANEFKLLGEYMKFLQAEGQILWLADPKLTLHVHHGIGFCLGLADNIINYDVCVCIVINNDTLGACQLLPQAIYIMNECNK